MSNAESIKEMADMAYALGTTHDPEQPSQQPSEGRVEATSVDEALGQLWAALEEARGNVEKARALSTGARPDGWSVGRLFTGELREAVLENPWVTAGDAGEDGASPPDGAPPAPPGDGPPTDLPVDDPMTAWRVQKGRIGEVLGSAKGLRFAPRFDGTLQILRVESRYSEDPETPGAWVRERRETIKATLADGREVTETIEAGREAFGRMLDEHFPAESHVHLLAERARLWQYMHRVSTPEVAETRRAVGPSRDLGWLCPPHWSVRDGALARTPFAVEPPGAAQELRRYRLSDLPLERLRELGRWVVDVLLRCDHHDGALTLPLLGAVLVPPLWHYVPTFSSWQRYAFFVQGGSGVGKTQLTRFFMSFWGDFLNPDGLSTWRDSATTIEDLLHRVVGAPVFVSDWKKANFTRDTEKQARALIQSYGDRSARGRSNVKAESQRKKEPRCQFLLDGEDLPEGQESTLGRMVIIKAEATEPTKRCATTDDLPGAARNVPDLPGLTAAWIAWVQRNVPTLTADLEAARDEVEALLPQGSANRSRIVRAYAAQVLAVRSFGTFLEQVLGLTGVVGPLHARSLDVHAAHGTAQLEHVQSESAGAALRAAQPLGATGVVDLTGQVRGIWRVLRYLRPGRAQAPTPIWEVACVAVGHKREMRGCALRNKPPIKCAACRRGEPAPPARARACSARRAGWPSSTRPGPSPRGGAGRTCAS